MDTGLTARRHARNRHTQPLTFARSGTDSGMLRGLCWYKDELGNVWTATPGAPRTGELLGWGTLDDHAALIVWECLTAQLGETGGETSREVAEWRRERGVLLD